MPLFSPKIFLFFAFLVNLGLGLLVCFRASPPRRVNLAFSFLAWGAAGWALSFFMVYVGEDASSKLIWGRMGFATASIMPAAFLLFAWIYPGEQRRIDLVKVLVISGSALMFFVLSFTNQIVSSLGSAKMFNYGPVYGLFSIYLTGFILLGLLFLVKTFRTAVGLERLQLKYCMIGMVLTSALGLIVNLFLPMAGISKFNWLGPSFTTIMVGFTTYSIVKHRLMDVNLVLRKGTTYAFLSVLLFVPAILLILFGQRLFFKEVNSLFSLLVFCVLFLATVIFHKIEIRMEKAVEQILFKNRYDYRETLGKFSRAMVSILDLESLSRKIVETVAQTMGVEKASLFLLSEEKGGYHLVESKNINFTLSPPSLSKTDPLPHYLQKLREITIREELAKGAHVPDLREVVRNMSRIEAEVSIPLISKGQLIGMVNLSQKLNKDIYSQEDVDLLSTLANQTTIAIENARLYEDLKKSKSYIRRADRLASLGTLTAGLAHEIRNPLVAIKTLTQLLPDRLEDEEFRNHFLSIAAGEVDRISSLVNELLEFARPSDPKLELENINTVLDGMILLVSTETKKKQIRIVKDYLEDLPLITVDREQIKQVFLNILLNAIDATPDNGDIFVKTRTFTKPGGESYLQVEFTDTGPGIPPEYMEDIFTPFFTTKSKGSGLGLSISHQIVQDHKGYIDLESQLDKGASFFINLPLEQGHPKRRRDDFKEKQDSINPFGRR